MIAQPTPVTAPRAERQTWQKMINPDLTHLTGDDNYTWLHFTNQRKRIMASTLAEWGRRLPHFVRTHKETIINPAHIIGHRHEAREVILTGGVHVLISRRRYQHLVQSGIINEHDALTEFQRKCYAVLVEKGPLTIRDIHEYVKGSFPNIDLAMLELRKRGLVTTQRPQTGFDPPLQFMALCGR